ncbi:MAG: ROK family protein [Thermodesulfobacteriota bacterium]
MEEIILAVDLGGTNVRIATVNLGGKILDKLSFLTEVSRGRERVMKDILSRIQGFLRGFPGEEFEVIGGGFGIPGAIALDQGVVTQSPNLPVLDGFNIRSWLQGRLRMPIFVENDANAFSLGEGWMGAARGVKEFCCLTLGTGVGGGIVLNGDIWHGTEGKAGEIGHMVIDVDGPPCQCGSRGCLEVFASGSAIRRMAIEAIEGDEKTDLVERCGGEIKKITAKTVYESARGGDRLSRGIFQRVGIYLGVGLANLVNLLNVELMVIGGRVSEAWDLFINPLREELEKRTVGSMGKGVRVERARCGDDAGILGAAYLVKKEFEKHKRRR